MANERFVQSLPGIDLLVCDQVLNLALAKGLILRGLSALSYTLID